MVSKRKLLHHWIAHILYNLYGTSVLSLRFWYRRTYYRTYYRAYYRTWCIACMLNIPGCELC